MRIIIGGQYPLRDRYMEVDQASAWQHLRHFLNEHVPVSASVSIRPPRVSRCCRRALHPGQRVVVWVPILHLELASVTAAFRAMPT